MSLGASCGKEKAEVKGVGPQLIAYPRSVLLMPQALRFGGAGTHMGPTLSGTITSAQTLPDTWGSAGGDR